MSISELVRHIHLNPIRAKIVSDLTDQKSKAADTVAHGYLIGSLLLVLCLHHLLDRLAALGQPLLKPGKRQ